MTKKSRKKIIIDDILCVILVDRKAATSLIKEIVKHSPDLARLVVEGGGLGVYIHTNYFA